MEMGGYYDSRGIDYDSLIQDYRNRQKENAAASKKLFGTVFVAYAMVMLTMDTMFPGIRQDKDFLVVCLLAGIAAGVAIVVGFIVSTLAGREKPFHQLIVKEMVGYVNLEKGLALKYTPYPKKQRFVNETGGIFTRFSKMETKDQINGMTAAYNKFTWYNMKLSVSTGKSQRTIFSGMYFVLDYPLRRVFQVRIHSSPKLKGVRFTRIQREKSLKIYVPAGEEQDYIDERFIDLVSDMKNKLNAKKVYLSAVGHQLHFAYEGAGKFKRPKEMDKEAVDEIVDRINGIVAVANKIAESVLKNP